MSHFHDAFSPSQNVGNVLGSRPCVRQTALYRQHESGNNMKDLLGMGHLAWDRDPNAGRHLQGSGAAHAQQEAIGPETANVCIGWTADPVAPGLSDSTTRDAGGEFQDDVAHHDGIEEEEPRHAALDGRGGRGIASRASRGGSNPAAIQRPPCGSRARGRGGVRGGSQSTAWEPTPCRGGFRSSSGVPAQTSGDEKVQQTGPGKRAEAMTRSPSVGTVTPSASSTPGRRRQIAQRGGYPAADASPQTPAQSPAQRSSQARSGSTPAPRISSERFDHMQVAPAFDTSSSRFATEYSRGGLPCRIDHGTCTNRLSWDVSSEEVCNRRDTLIVLCAGGLCETRHPYATVARLAFGDLALWEGCPALGDEALRRVMAHLRMALLTEPNSAGASRSPGGSASSSVFSSALLALRQLVSVEGERLVSHLHLVLPPIGKRMFSKAYREPIQETLRDLETFGGPEAAKAMRMRGVAPGMA